MNEQDLLAGYRALRLWVERERRRLERTEERASQRYLRRSRLVDDIDLLTIREFLRELRDLARPKTSKRRVRAPNGTRR